MPKKTDEPTRSRVVELRKAGQSYSQIQKETGLAGLTVSKILKEAGMTNSKNKIGSTATTSPPIQSTPVEQTESTPSSVAPIAVSSSTNGNGLNEFQPPPAKVKAEVVLYARCSACGSMHQFTKSDPPKECLACGEVFE